jgi:hypothetical protein
LDFDGNEIKRFQKHSASINAISCEPSGEWIATAVKEHRCMTVHISFVQGDDGRVFIVSLYTEEVVTADYSRPILAIQLDPEYVHNKKRQFCCGGKEAKLILNSKGYM